METLKESLKDWQDDDVAQFYLGRSLGLFGEEHNFSSDTKHVFWTNNPVGNSLYDILMKLSEIGVLLYDEPVSRFRWNPDFHGSWE